jgi:hypothetical protein
MATLSIADGTSLKLWSWPRPVGPARGTVLVVHGLGEHGGRYAQVAARLAGQGWAVAGYDQRGHGLSTGPRGGLAADDSLLADLGCVIESLRREMHGPLLLLGHSMGGLVAGRYVAEALSPAPAPWWQPVDGLVMSSPAIDPGMSRAQKLLLALAAPVAPSLALSNGLKPEWVCSDPAVVRAYVADPLVHDRVTPRLVRFIVAAGALLLASAPRWTTPTLLLYAGADRCVAPRGSEDFAAAAPRTAVLAQRYPEMAHEIFNEPGQDRVLSDLVAWLSTQAPARA